MRNLLLLTAGGALCALQDGAEGSVSYHDTSLVPSLTDMSYAGRKVGYEPRLESLVAARSNQNRRRRTLTMALLGVLAVALSAAFLIMQCFMLLKSKGLIAASVRRLAEGQELTCLAEGAGDKEEKKEKKKHHKKSWKTLLCCGGEKEEASEHTEETTVARRKVVDKRRKKSSTKIACCAGKSKETASEHTEETTGARDKVVDKKETKEGWNCCGLSKTKKTKEIRKKHDGKEKREKRTKTAVKFCCCGCEQEKGGSRGPKDADDDDDALSLTSEISQPGYCVCDYSLYGVG